MSIGISGCAPMNTDSSQSAESSFDMNDVMFAQMMIPHHEQALELAGLASARTSNPEILDLATRIESAQGPEIATMESWLAEAGASRDMGHIMHMPGIVSNDDMDTIAASRDSEFDVLFLTHMIAHHEGAVEMAEDVLATTSNGRVTDLANAIISAQNAEIDEMKRLLETTP